MAQSLLVRLAISVFVALFMVGTASVAISFGINLFFGSYSRMSSEYVRRRSNSSNLNRPIHISFRRPSAHTVAVSGEWSSEVAGVPMRRGDNGMFMQDILLNRTHCPRPSRLVCCWRFRFIVDGKTLHDSHRAAVKDIDGRRSNQICIHTNSWTHPKLTKRHPHLPHAAAPPRNRYTPAQVSTPRHF
jgi:hypothetical protein